MMYNYKIQFGNKSTVKLSLIMVFSVFLLSSLFLFYGASSKDSESSGSLFNTGSLLLIFLVVFLILTFLVITENPIVEFLINNYKLTIIASVFLFLLILFISTDTFKSITGFISVFEPIKTVPKTTEDTQKSEFQSDTINSIKITEPMVALTEIDVGVYNTVNNVKIDVSRLENKPNYVIKDISGVVYQYIKVEKTNLNDDNIKEVKIKFSVQKSWMTNNGIDKLAISLYRYQDDTWIKISTYMVDEDDKNVNYEVDTGRLSLFAIAGESKLPRTTIITTTITTTTTAETNTSTTTFMTSTIPSTITTTTSITTTIPFGTQPTHSYDCSAGNVKCTLETVTITNPDDSKMTINYQKPINFFNQTSKKQQSIDKKLKFSSESGWKYAKEDGFYNIYINDTHTKIEKDNAIFIFRPSIPVQLSKVEDNKLIWDISNNLIKMTVEITFDEAKIEKLITIHSIDPTILSSLPSFKYDELFDSYGINFDSSKLKFGDVFSIVKNVTMWDNCGNVYSLTGWDVKGKNMSLNIDKTWFNQSCFPYWINPEIKFNYEKEIDSYKINNDLNEYYFNATSTLNINDIKDYWAKNDVCLGLYFGNVWHEFCGDSLDWTWYNSTNFKTYMNLTGDAELKYAGYTVNTKVEYYLEKDYPEVLGTITLENTGNKDISDSYLKINTHDIRVNLTYDNNTFRVNTSSFWEAWSGWKEYFLNQPSLDVFYTENDLTSRKYSIFDNSTESWVEMSWNNSYWKNGISNNMNYNLSVKKGSEVNAPVDLMFLTGSFNKNDKITTNFKWADAIKQDYISTDEYFDSEITKLTNLAEDSIVNGTQYHLRDINFTLVMDSNKKVNISILMYNISKILGNSISSYTAIRNKFDCVNYYVGNETLTYCPNDTTSDKEITIKIVNLTLQLPERDVNFSMPPQYLLVNNKTGVLTKYDMNMRMNGKNYNLSSLEYEMFRLARVKLPSVFKSTYDEYQFDLVVDFSSVNETSYCIKFPIQKFSNLFINITLPIGIKNYTFGRPEFIVENYTLENSAIARIKPYPCCNITGVTLQPGEVCSI